MGLCNGRTKKESWRELIEKIVIGLAIVGSIILVFSLLGKLKTRTEIPTVEIREFPTIQPLAPLKGPEQVAVEAIQQVDEEELARTILQIDGIEAVRVQIVIPEKTLFKEDQKEPTASVILRLKQGVKFP